MATTGPSDGAWGLRFPSLAAAAGHILVEAPADWAPVTIDLHLGLEPEIHNGHWNPKDAYIPLLAGGLLEITWPYEVTLTLPTHPIPEFVVQPHLATAAASISVHAGRQAFHAGAVLVDGGAWAIFGAKEAGKSTTLGRLHQMGVGILTDDVLICDGLDALAGPRCVDLRLAAAQRLNIGEDFGIVGLRERWRVQLPPCPDRVPLRGWLLLEWSKDDDLIAIPAAERLALLDQNQALRLPPHDPLAFLELSSLPGYRWHRPRSWETFHHSIDRLLAGLARR